MNYENIKHIIHFREREIKDVLSEINISEAAFYKMIRNKSMKISTLEKIADEIRVDVRVFFEETPI